MRALIQRVRSASVSVDGEVVGKIGAGILIFLGVTHEDTSSEVQYVADKCINLRIFDDEKGLMNRSLLDTAGEVLIISQFTLYGDTSHGRRPSYSEAARPEPAKKLYEEFVKTVRASVPKVETGIFAAEMLVELCNDGPVTLMVESKK
ncbi:MAG: D-tyrosyl-tRNA(Tyr) deacylase [Lentisphaeria bacterium]|nr:D-tyrosyl-tRNA(Tyr) deacylase [Lentisphaeria bacterium]